jgi:magnesium-transporting ATPase (P-type)
VGEIPFSSERKLMSTLEADLEDEGPVAVVTKGAPDVLLARCTSERVAGKVRPLTDARRADVMATVDRQPRALGRRGQEGVRASGQIAGPPTCGRLNP